jgi:hypothetical protein
MVQLRKALELKASFMRNILGQLPRGRKNRR